METKLEKKYNKAIELLERWVAVIIPANVWSSPAEDYLLPLDTQEFLNDIKNSKEVK